MTNATTTTNTTNTTVVKDVTTPVPIPEVQAEASDPTDRYYDHEMDDADRREDALAVLTRTVRFEKDAEAEQTESCDGVAQFDVPTGRFTAFWQWCADEGLTLADLDKGIYYSGATIECAVEDLLGYDTVNFSEEACDFLMAVIDRGEFDKFAITAEGCAQFVG